MKDYPSFDLAKCNYFSLNRVSSVPYDCGYCNTKVSPDKGFKMGTGRDGSGLEIGGIHICPNCKGPTFITFLTDYSKSFIFPRPSFGNPVKHLPEEVKGLYEEARKCTSVGCDTAAVMICRKILMNIAVHKGAKGNQTFAYYVDFLSDKGYIPPDGKEWVSHIKNKGNEANHEIRLMRSEDAEEIIKFTEMLLKFVYEFPSSIPKVEKKKATQ